MPTEVLAERLSARARHASPLQVSVLACGPTAMLVEVARICLEARVKCQVSLENQLGCGVGACYGCVVPGIGEDGAPVWLRVCKDGPVFPVERIDWERIRLDHPRINTD